MQVFRTEGGIPEGNEESAGKGVGLAESGPLTFKNIAGKDMGSPIAGA